RVAVALFAQRLWSGPAFTVGAGVMVYVTWSLTALQRPLPALVSARVTVPAARSAALGVYATLGAVLLGLYVPLPPLQIAPVAPLTVPLKVMAALLAHTVPLGPASTKGAGVKVISLLSETTAQFPLPVLVSVRVRLPPASSAGVGV